LGSLRGCDRISLHRAKNNWIVRFSFHGIS
jgi:hypothetical protein